MFGKRVSREADSGSAIASRASADPAGVLRDELGLHHLWYLELRLQQELLRAARMGAVFSMASWQRRMLPGEEAGFETLERCAGILKEHLRTYDVASYIDGQRFVAVLFDADARDAATVAFRVKGALQLHISGAGKWQAGLATFGQDGLDGNALIQAALRRLDEDTRL